MIKRKSNYTVYEYIYKTKQHGEIIILGHIENKEDKNWLDIWLKTSENMGLMHFIVGYEMENESSIEGEIMKLAENNYFDDFIRSALENEEMLDSQI